MPTSGIKGVTGNVTLKDSAAASIAIKITAVGIEQGQQIFNFSAFGDTGTYADFETGGLKAMSGSASGFVLKGASNANPFDLNDQAASIDFSFATGCTMSVNVIVSSIQLGFSHDGVLGISFNWVKADSADPTIAWA